MENPKEKGLRQIREGVPLLAVFAEYFGIDLEELKERYEDEHKKLCKNPCPMLKGKL